MSAEPLVPGQRTGTGYSHKTHCLRGHTFTVENTYIHPTTGGRYCRTCRRQRVRDTRQRRKERLMHEVTTYLSGDADQAPALALYNDLRRQLDAANARTRRAQEREMAAASLLAQWRTRAEALELAARDLLKTARVGYKIAIQARQDDGLVSEMVTSCEQMAALLEKDV